MSLSIPVFDSRLTNAVTSDGLYRATFNVSTWLFGVPYKTGQVKQVGNKKLEIINVEEDRVNDTLKVTFRVSTVQIPANQANIGGGAIVVALIVLAGLSVIYLSLVKVERIVETPAGQLGAVAFFALVIAVIFGAAIFWWKKLRG